MALLAWAAVLRLDACMPPPDTVRSLYGAQLSPSMPFCSYDMYMDVKLCSGGHVAEHVPGTTQRHTA